MESVNWGVDSNVFGDASEIRPRNINSTSEFERSDSRRDKFCKMNKKPNIEKESDRYFQSEKLSQKSV